MHQYDALHQKSPHPSLAYKRMLHIVRMEVVSPHNLKIANSKATSSLPTLGRMPTVERHGSYRGHRNVNLPSRQHPNPTALRDALQQ